MAEKQFMKKVYCNPACKAVQNETDEKVNLKNVKDFLSEQDAYTARGLDAQHYFFSVAGLVITQCLRSVPLFHHVHYAVGVEMGTEWY